MRLIDWREREIKRVVRKIENPDSASELEAEGGEGREGGLQRSTLIRLLSKRGIEISIDFIGRLVPNSPRAAETDGIHCVTRHLPQIKLMANKTPHGSKISHRGMGEARPRRIHPEFLLACASTLHRHRVINV